MVQAISESKNRPGDPRNREVVRPVYDDPQIGNFSTPVNSSPIVKAFIGNLPAYRQGLSPLRRGLEVGMAHGYWLIGPFAKLGPLRDTNVANLSGLLSTVGVVVISSVALSLYASRQPSPPLNIVTTPEPPEGLRTREGWSDYTTGFLIGGIGGAAFAYLLLSNISVLQNLF